MLHDVANLMFLTTTTDRGDPMETNATLDLYSEPTLYPSCQTLILCHYNPQQIAQYFSHVFHARFLPMLSKPQEPLWLSINGPNPANALETQHLLAISGLWPSTTNGFKANVVKPATIINQILPTWTNTITISNTVVTPVAQLVAMVIITMVIVMVLGRNQWLLDTITTEWYSQS